MTASLHPTSAVSSCLDGFWCSPGPTAEDCRLFYPRLDELLDDNMLVGSSWAAREALRPLAYSMLAELVHHLRAELTLPQIKTVVHIFSRRVPHFVLDVPGPGRSPRSVKRPARGCTTCAARSQNPTVRHCVNGHDEHIHALHRGCHHVTLPAKGLSDNIKRHWCKSWSACAKVHGVRPVWICAQDNA